MTGCGMGRQRRRLSWRGGGIWCTLAEGLSGSNHGRGGRTEGEKHEGLSSGQGKSPAKMKGKKKKKRSWQPINVSVLFTYCLGLNLKSGEYGRNRRESSLKGKKTHHRHTCITISHHSLVENLLAPILMIPQTF